MNRIQTKTISILYSRFIYRRNEDNKVLAIGVTLMIIRLQGAEYSDQCNREAIIK